MKVKICGITNVEDAILCERLGADALGFIFYKNSKRYIEPNQVSGIISQLSPFTVKVGVFVNENADMINRIISETKINLVQVHNDSNISEKDILVPTIKAFRVNNEFDFNILGNFINNYILLDSYSQNEYGGTGKIFDWNKIPKNIIHKIILAGGISSANIEYICKEIKPVAVDLSSSLEKYPGKKDPEKVSEFFNLFYQNRSN